MCCNLSDCDGIRHAGGDEMKKKRRKKKKEMESLKELLSFSLAPTEGKEQLNKQSITAFSLFSCFFFVLIYPPLSTRHRFSKLSFFLHFFLLFGWLSTPRGSIRLINAVAAVPCVEQQQSPVFSSPYFFILQHYYYYHFSSIEEENKQINFLAFFCLSTCPSLLSTAAVISCPCL